jgi:hypothetical protein
MGTPHSDGKIGNSFLMKLKTVNNGTVYFTIKKQVYWPHLE